LVVNGLEIGNWATPALSLPHVMSTMKRGLAIFSVFVFSCSYGQLKFELMTDTQGAPIRSVTCLLKDKTGYLWIGTQTGLLRYDGSEFAEFRHNPQDSFSLPSSFVLALAEDSLGRLWVGTLAGLCVYGVNSETFTSVFPEKQTAPINPTVAAMTATPNGMWFGSYIGLSFFDFRTRHIQTFSLPASNPLGRLSRTMPQVKAIAEIRATAEEKLWIATGSGLHQFDMRTNQWSYQLRTEPTLNDSIAAALMQHIHQDKQGAWWGGSWGKGLLHFDKTGRLQEHLVFSKANLPEGTKNIVRHCIDFTYQGREGLLLGTYDAGLLFFDRDQQSFTPIAIDGQKIVPVEEVLLDDQGILWVASPHGLYKADPYAQRFDWHAFDESFFLNNFRNVTAFCEVDSINVLTVVHSNGLFLFNRATHTSRPVASRIYTQLENITAIHRVREGWFFLAGRRMSGWWHMATDRFDPLPDLQRTLAIVPLPNGHVLLPAFNKLVDVDLQTRQAHTMIATQDSIRAIAFYDAIMANDTTWLVASSKGLWAVDLRSRDTRYLPGFEQSVTSFARHGKRLFVGTNEGLFEWAGGHMNPVTMDGSVRFTVVGRTAVDGDHLWLATNNGLIRFSVHDGTVVQFTNEDGLHNNTINSFALTKLSSGPLLLGQTGGLFVIHPERVPLNRVKPKPLITRFEVAGKSLACPLAENEIVLDYHQNQIQLAFAGLNFAQPQRNQYAHRLVGVSDSWNKGNTATYAGMKGGNYVLEIKAANNDGLWSAPVRFPILIKKPYWEQAWFIAFVAALILFGIYLLYRYQLNRKMRLPAICMMK
jgi:ligand-binding sensor domain-containing protein